MLTGTELLAKVAELQAQYRTKTETVIACGYVRENGQAAYTAFYEALIAAKQPQWQKQKEDVETEIEFDDEAQEEEFLELCINYPQEALEIYHNNIGNLDDFEEAYQGEYKNEADFAEEIIAQFVDHNLPSWVVVDYQATWDCALRYDYWEENGYFFRNI